MMKKAYAKPELGIERFAFTDILTESGIGAGDSSTDPGTGPWNDANALENELNP